MLSYKIRIDSHDRSAIRMLLTKYTDSYLLAFEGEGSQNPHCHGLFSTTSKPATIRSNLRKKFGSGNGSYSMKELDEEYPLEYIAYIIKEGDYEIHNIPPEIIERAKAHDIQVKKEMKEKKSQRKTILKQIEEKYFSKCEKGVIDGTYVMKEFVVEKVLEFYQESGGLVRQFQIVAICQTLCLKYVNSYAYSYKNKILDML